MPRTWRRLPAECRSPEDIGYACSWWTGLVVSAAGTRRITGLGNRTCGQETIREISNTLRARHLQGISGRTAELGKDPASSVQFSDAPGIIWRVCYVSQGDRAVVIERGRLVPWPTTGRDPRRPSCGRAARNPPSAPSSASSALCLDRRSDDPLPPDGATQHRSLRDPASEDRRDRM